MKVHFEQTECTRCGGSGHYSYCEMYGTTCFKCGGTGKQLSAAGLRARDRYNIFCNARRTKKLVQDVVPGDRIRIGSDPFRTVASAQPSSTTGTDSNGRKVRYIDLVFTKPIPSVLGPCSNYGACENTLVTLALSAEDQAAAFEYAKTLKGARVE